MTVRKRWDKSDMSQFAHRWLPVAAIGLGLGTAVALLLGAYLVVLDDAPREPLKSARPESAWGVAGLP